MLLLVACSKSNDKPYTPPAQKYVLMRVEYSGGATAVIDNVSIGDPSTHLSTTIGGPYSQSVQDSVISPMGLNVVIQAHGGDGTDKVELIDQNNRKSTLPVSTTETGFVSLTNFYAVDSFTVRVYR